MKSQCARRESSANTDPTLTKKQCTKAKGTWALDAAKDAPATKDAPKDAAKPTAPTAPAK